MQAADTIKHSKAYRFLSGAQQGFYTAPQEMLDTWAEFEQHVNDGMVTRPWGRRDWANTKAEQKAEEVAMRFRSFAGIHSYHALITENLRPAQADVVDSFTAARATAGALANVDQPDFQALSAPDDVRTAARELLDHARRYSILRNAYENLRKTESLNPIGRPDADPRGETSPLAEIRNLPALIPEWQQVGMPNPIARLRVSWPWRGNSTHLKLGWLTDHGAELWMPTEREHDALWRQYRADRRKAAA